VERLKAQLSELKRKESEMLAMQAESSRLAEEERRATDQRALHLDQYHRSLAEASTPLTLPPSALSELEAIQQANSQREQKLKAYAAEEVRLRALKMMAEEQYRLQRAVDVCFVVDCTSSMALWISAVKDKVMDVVQGIKRENDVGEVRVAFIGYRDYFDAERFIVVDFTQDVAAFRSELQHVTAVGGGDIPEDMAGGLFKALTLSWKARTRSLILIADAPCHGREFHSFEEDVRNEEVTDDVHDPATVLTQLRATHIDLCFVKITKGTDQMLERFRVYYDRKEEGRAMRVIVLGNSVELFLPQIVATITDSITRTKGVNGMRSR
jgi:Mg-chelatase subunit ChlD